MSHFNKAIIHTLASEGGYVNDSNDPGGATNWGVSIRFLKSAGDYDKDGWLDGDIDHDGDVDINDIKKMTKEEAVDIYKMHFWDKYKYENIQNYDVAARIFDMTVNMGARQAAKLAQRAAGASADGVLGPKSFGAINKKRPDEMMRELRFQHVKFYLDLMERRPKFTKYKNGWLRRACS